MTSGQLVLVALVFGVAVGAVFALLLKVAADQGRAALELVDEPLPDGISAMLSLLEMPAIVLDGSDTVIGDTAAARSLGLVVGDRLAHPELERLVDTARAQHTGRAGEFELRRSLVGSATLDVQARATPIGVVSILLVVEDHSDTRRLEAVRRDFVANVSHELKTPIGAVSLLAEAMQAAADDPAQVRKFADRLSTEATRLGTITREIIEFSRLQSADPLREPATVELDSVLMAAVDQNRVAAEAQGIEMVLAKHSGLRVLGDAAQLTSAVHNLIANAVQFSPDHGRVGVAARVRDDVVEITVTDQGVGINAEDIERVFERFFRADDSRSRATGGTGLGLSIVKHVAQNHGGEVRVWSRPGQGSTFTIVLPVLLPLPLSKAQRRREREPA